jgi:hypothetical protein
MWKDYPRQPGKRFRNMNSKKRDIGDAWDREKAGYKLTRF